MEFLKQNAINIITTLLKFSAWLFLLIICITQMALFDQQQETNKLLELIFKQQSIETQRDIQSNHKEIKGEK